MLKEFKAFLMRGNVLDLAVAVVVGGAFGKIVASLVKDIIMPPIGLLLGKVDFANLFIALDGKSYATLDEAQKAAAPTWNYGLFINTIIEFLVVALAIFVVLKLVTKLQERGKKPEPVAAPTTKECPYCLTTIALKATRCPNCTSELKKV
jgi:large conductance mechanosensitive channel